MNGRILTPLLDRLLSSKAQPDTSSDNPVTCSKQQYRKAVLRDLQNLLNTRCDGFWNKTAFQNTVLNYGLPDLGETQAGSIGSALSIAREIKQAIESFEPRLRSVQVIPDNYPATLNHRPGEFYDTCKEAGKQQRQSFTITAELFAETLSIKFSASNTTDIFED